MFHKTLTLVLLLSVVLFSSRVFSVNDGIEDAAENDMQQAEQALLKLEATIGENAEESTITEAASPADKDAASSKPWLPAAKEFDWVQLTSGEWLKGEIKSMYNESLEFDSDKLNLLIIDWGDVKYLKSYRPSNVNIEFKEPVTGSLQISDDTVTITTGEEVQEFDRIELISLTPAGNRELDLWAVRFTLGLNVKSGNTDQADYTSKLSAKRRTAKSRFILDYIGNISKIRNAQGDLTETVNNHRINAGLDVYATRYFFYQPAFAEYYRDSFQNIEQRITVGVGIGYTLFDSAKYEWDVNGGPAFVTTNYISVQQGQDKRVDAGALVFGTNFNAELTDTLDFIFKYNIQASKDDAGGYTHHMTATFESELTGHLDFDLSMIWDRISQPRENDLGEAPEQDDYRLSVGVTYTY
ncbi:hypothetical protein MNBD_GAMMA05-2397 [hydrothermal vent metagenome]|uniref:DUF481 domain-containing protein n=1 Tax=hydrothermal vent metagenome TaxID=652676 RepID=A0A3B0WIZ5_9ZZZZ